MIDPSPLDDMKFDGVGECELGALTNFLRSEGAAPVEALDAVAARDRACLPRVCGMAVRADVDRDRLRSRADAERCAARRTAHVYGLNVGMLTQSVLLITTARPKRPTVT